MSTDPQELTGDHVPLTTVGSAADDLLALLRRPVHTWRPDLGDADTIAGKVVNVTTTLSDFGAYPIVDVDDGVSIWRIHGLGSIMLREIGFRSPRDGVYVTKLAPGDTFGAHDPGERVQGKVKGRSPYRNVRVIHRPANGVARESATSQVYDVVEGDDGRTPEFTADDIPF